MKLWKKEIVFSAPLWSLLVVGLAVLVLLTAVVLEKTNFQENYLLRTLDEEQIVSAYAVHSGCDGAGQILLSGDELAEVLAAVNKVRIAGKPYEGSPNDGGDPWHYRFVLKNGSQMDLSSYKTGTARTKTGYYYRLDGYDYFICYRDDPAGLTVYNRLEELFRTTEDR